MRMWMLPISWMCGQHRTGEHSELHKHRHVFEKKQAITGRIYAENGFVQIEPANMQQRHDELAKTLNHKSPYVQPDISYLPVDQQNAKIDFLWNFTDLFFRCHKCRELMIKYFKEKQK